MKSLFGEEQRSKMFGDGIGGGIGSASWLPAHERARRVFGDAVGWQEMAAPEAWDLGFESGVVEAFGGAVGDDPRGGCVRPGFRMRVGVEFEGSFDVRYGDGSHGRGDLADFGGESQDGSQEERREQ